jgi:hypothetical protein
VNKAVLWVDKTGQIYAGYIAVGIFHLAALAMLDYRLPIGPEGRYHDVEIFTMRTIQTGRERESPREDIIRSDYL